MNRWFEDKITELNEGNPVVTENLEVGVILFPCGLYSLLFLTPAHRCPEWARRRYNETLILHRKLLGISEDAKEE